MDLAVLHHVACWLPQTEIWLYEQVRQLPNIVTHIACDSTANLDQFRLPNIDDLQQPNQHRSFMVRAAERLDRPFPPREWVRLARRTGARVLHSHFGHVGWRDRPLARRAGLKHVVTFYGYDVGAVPNWRPRWRNLDLFERVALILCEGPHMAARIAALGCPSEKVRVHHLDGQTGLLAEERDVAGLVTHIRWLTVNVDRWRELTSAARRRAEQQFNARVQSQRLAEIYHEVLAS